MSMKTDEADLKVVWRKQASEYRRESHTYGGDDASEAPVQDEQRKTWTGTPAARQRAMVEEIPLSTRRNSDKGNHAIERELGN